MVSLSSFFSFTWVRQFELYMVALAGLMMHDTALAADVYPAVMEVSYPEVIDVNARDFDAYFLEQLQLALDKSGVPYRMKPFPRPTIVESRSEYYLRQGRYGVHWLNTNARRETKLIPIRVPLFKGLIGWRLLLITPQQQARFANIRSVDQLKPLIAGQGHDWPDTQVLKTNQFRVETSTRWDALFHMLAMGRLDYFPRSLIEVRREQRIFSDLHLEIENTLVLNYPAAYYFFVSKKYPELASAIEKGLQIAIEDGTFDQNFYARFGPIIQQSNLDKRTTMTLVNPLLSYPNDPRLWFNPARDLARLKAAELPSKVGDGNP